MADREKVIQGIEYCLFRSQEQVRCGDCPYWYDDFESGCHVYDMMRDALALLREQEPRVMTLEEVIHSKGWVWYQWKNTHYGWAIAVNCDGKWIEWEDSTTDQLCKYGKKWRCWTYRPTPEQMRDTKWEGDSDGE